MFPCGCSRCQTSSRSRSQSLRTARCAMSARRWRSCWRRAPRLPRTPWRRSRSTSNSLHRCRTATFRRRTNRCCSRTMEPTSPSNSGRSAAMRLAPSRMPPMCGARVFACSDTWRCRWRRAGCWPSGTAGADGSRSTAAPRCCSSTAAPWPSSWASPRTRSISWRTTSAAVLARAASSIRRISSFPSLPATPAGR